MREHESDALSDAEERAGNLEKKAGELNKAAEDERSARIKLEAQVNPRRLSAAERNDISKSLKPFAGKTVGIATYMQDAEAMILAVQIGNAIGGAKILIHNRIGSFEATGFPLMMSVVVDKNSSDKKLEFALVKALKTKGKLATFDDDVAFGEGSRMYMPPGPTHEDAFIFVGVKPIDQDLIQSKPSNNTHK